MTKHPIQTGDAPEAIGTYSQAVAAGESGFTREELWDVLQKLYVERNCTVILVTHDLREAVYLADTVYVMSARPGKIILNRKIELARPRKLDDMYGRDVVELIHDLRHHIHVARSDQ